ncbi:MAG: sulfurtransferase TusA family protein [Myxococcales bacterium]|nr:sulfurtransferase TusA family protein [Myxococcales bacterium]
MTEADDMENDTTSIDQSISTPLLVLIRSLRRLTAGEEIEVVAQTESEKHEIERWVGIAGHEVVTSESLSDGGWRYLIRKQLVSYQ